MALIKSLRAMSVQEKLQSLKMLEANSLDGPSTLTRLLQNELHVVTVVASLRESANYSMQSSSPFTLLKPEAGLQIVHKAACVLGVKAYPTMGLCMIVTSVSKLLKANFPMQVFDPDSGQAKLYRMAIKPIVKEVLEGFNCTIFAYGQTGTGKTYTINHLLHFGYNEKFILLFCPKRELKSNN